MLTPEQLDKYPDNLVELYSQAEIDIIQDIARRISTYDYFIPAAEHQYKKLLEMGSIHDEILKRLTKLTGLSKRELEKLMFEAGYESIKFDDDVYKKVGLDPLPIEQSPVLISILDAGVNSTNGLFENLTRTTANTASKQFENILDNAYMQITTGAFDTNTAIRNAIKDLTGKGLASISYPNGHISYIESAVRRAVITGVNQTSLKMQETRAHEVGSDLVETSAHAGARPSHAIWQGKVFSLSGTHPKYLHFATVTGYGTGSGLGGWNCRHSFYPFFEGFSEPAYSKQELEKMTTKDYEYNGEKMTEYEATQKQRAIERKIRRWKREYKGMEAAGLPSDESAAKIAQWQNIQKDFLKQTGLKRQADREQIPGFGKSEASKVRAAVKKAKNEEIRLANLKISEYNKKRLEIYEKIQSGELPLKLNVGNQNKHIRNSHSYKPQDKKSYLYGDLETAQNLVDKYHGIGELRFSNSGNWTNKEFISINEDIGVTFDLDTSIEKSTNRFAIHYGKKGTHVVPVERIDKK